METAPPLFPLPPRRRFTTGCVLYRNLLLPVFGIISLYWFDKRQGERAWEKYKATARARGVKLYPSEYERPAIPDEENYAAAPIFWWLTYDGSGQETRRRLEIPRPRVPPPENPRRASDQPPVKPDPLILYQEAFVREKWINAKSDRPAVDVLAALERCEPALVSIREASVRPESQWPQAVDKPDMNRLYCGVPLLHASTDFLLRARALLALQRPDDALAEMRYALRAARSLNDEPGIGAALYQLDIWTRYFDVAEDGIAANAWEGHHLKALAKDSVDLHVLAAVVRGLDSERVYGNRLSEVLASRDHPRLMKLLAPADIGTPQGFDIFWSVMPSGWIRRDQVEYNRLVDSDIEAVNVNEEIISPDFSRSAKIVAGYTSLHRQLARFVTTAALRWNEPMVYKAGFAHTRCQELRVECALTHYRREHGEFPPSLDTLVPAFLERAPKDVMDGQSLRYRRTDTGGCVIWSIGENRIDDGGKTEFRPYRLKSLDWVSELPP